MTAVKFKEYSLWCVYEFMFDMSDYFGVPIEEIFALDKSTESVQRGK